MARRKIDQWGITYAMPVWKSGYTWWSPDHGKEPVLYPSGGSAVFETRASAEDLERLRNPFHIKTGLAFSRKAFNRFRDLSECLAGEMSDEDARQLVLEFANEFGPLKEHADVQSIADWRSEAVDFLDMLDVSRAVRRGSLAEFSRGVTVSDCVEGRYGLMMVYRGNRPTSRDFVIAHEADVTPLLRAPNVSERALRDFDEALRGGSRAQAMMLLSKAANPHLVGGMTFAPSWVDNSQFFFSPTSLLPMLYVKLWIDTVKEQEIDRVMTCLHCEAPLIGRRSKKFCDDTCRTAFHNRRRSART